MDFMSMVDEGGGEKLLVQDVAGDCGAEDVVGGLRSQPGGLAFVREVGCAQLVVNIESDNAPAITDLLDKVGRLRAAASAQSVETSYAYASASSGVVERGVQSAQAPLRALRSAIPDILAMARGVRGVLAQPQRCGPRPQDLLREVQGEAP